MDEPELQPGESITHHLIAGGMAGVIEHVAMFPIDTIKTTMQIIPVEGQHSSTIVGTTRRLIQTNGFFGLFRGIGTVLGGAAPAHALYFATYEFSKSKLATPGEHQPIQTGLAGAIATITMEALWTPVDTIKQKMQIRRVQYKNIFDCGKTVLKSEGLGALYAGYTTTLAMNVPYNAIYFATYESLRRFLKRGKETEFDLFAHFLAGAGAGGIAGALTNPFDVAKTRLQTQSDIGKSRHYKGIMNTLKIIWKEEGMSGYSRGLRPRVLLHSMSASITWLTYEYVKFFMNTIGFNDSEKK